MLNILHGHENIIRVDKKLKVTDPITVINEGMAVKLDVNREIVLTGPNAAIEDFVWWAFTSANVPDEFRSDFYTLGQITLITGFFIGETDQFVGAGSYNVGTKLSVEGGLLFNGTTGDFTVARALGVPVGDKLQFITLPLAAII